MSDPDAVARELLRSMPGDPAQSAEYFLREPDESAWMTMEKAGGMRVNMLWEDPETGAWTRLTFEDLTWRADEPVPAIVGS